MDLNFYISLFTFILSSYLVSILAGYVLSRTNVLNIRWFMRKRKFLTDPLSKKAHKILYNRLILHIVSREWLEVCLLILLNNLLLGAFVLRTIYGLTIVLPYILTVWEGLGQGVVFSKTKPNLIFFFEFSGYLFATLAGMSLGLSLVLSIWEGIRIFIATLKNLLYIYSVVAVLLSLGALLETIFMKKLGPPKVPEFDISKLMEDMLRSIE